MAGTIQEEALRLRQNIENLYTKTVEKLCPEFSITGEHIVFMPVENYPLGLVSTLPASETGYTKLTLYLLGKNLLVPNATSKTASGVTFTVNEDNSITVNGTATAEIYYELGKVMYIAGYSYIISGCADGGSSTSKYCVYVAHEGNNIYDVGKGASLTAVADKNNTHRILIKKGCTVDNLVFRPMVRMASINDGAYEKYSDADNRSFTVDFGKTVYGGSFDWITGILTDENGETTKLESPLVTSLPGINTLRTSAGTVTVSGRSDPIAVINDLRAAI